MNLSYEYIQFLNEKITQYLPHPNVRVGNKINFRCPICGDSAKSMTKKRGWYFLETASYYCWNCGVSMSGIKFLEVLSGTDYETLKREYIKLFLKSGHNSSLSSYMEVPDEEPNYFNMKPCVNPDWKKPLTDDAIQYLKNRKVLSAPFLTDPLFSTYNKEKSEEYILIPWKMNGVDAYYQLNDFKKIRSMKYIFPKNKKKLIYGLDNVDPSYKKIFVFEGVYDSLFVKNAIAVGTKAITDYQMKLIKQRWPNHQVIVSFDNDRAGISSMMKLISKNYDMQFFKWFNQNTKQKDINDYVLAKNDVNLFTEPNVLDRMICDRLQMKLFLLQNDLWHEEKVVKKSALVDDRRSIFILK